MLFIYITTRATKIGCVEACEIPLSQVPYLRTDSWHGFKPYTRKLSQDRSGLMNDQNNEADVCGLSGNSGCH